MSDVAHERSFLDLKQRLELAGYRHALGIESVPLVSALFTDLESQTDAVSVLEDTRSKQQRLIVQLQSQLEPLKRELARVVRENNALHMEIVNGNDCSTQAEKQYRIHVKRVEGELTDARFLNQQLNHKCRAVEKERDDMRSRLSALHEKMKAFDKESVPIHRRERMELDRPALEDISDHIRRAPRPEPYVKDLLELAEQQVLDLNRRLNSCTEEKNALTTRISDYSNRLRERDEEIQRLGSKLEAGLQIEAATESYLQGASQSIVDHLHDQIQFLHERVSDLDQERKRLQKEARENELAVQENKALKEEIRQRNIRENRLREEINDLELSMENMQEEIEQQRKIIADSEHHISHSHKSISALEQEKPSSSHSDHPLVVDRTSIDDHERGVLRARVVDLESEIVRLRHELEKIHCPSEVVDEDRSQDITERDVGADLRTARDRIASLETEIEDITRKLRRAEASFDAETRDHQEEKQRSARLVEEIRDLKRKKTDLEERIDEFDIENSKLERRIELYNDENESLRLEVDSLMRRVTDLSVSDVASKAGAELSSEQRVVIEELHERVRSLRKDLSDRDISVARLEIEKRNVEGRLEQSRLEVERVRSDADALAEENAEYLKHAREFDSRLADLQEQIRILASERDNSYDLYENAKSEAHALKEARNVLDRQLDRAKQNASSLSEENEALQLRLQDLENQISSLHTQTQNVSSERDAVSERDRVWASENARLSSRVDALEERLRHSSAQLDEARKALRAAESERDTANASCTDLRNRIDEQREQIERLESLISRIERSREETISLLEQRQLDQDELNRKLRISDSEAVERLKQIQRLESDMENVHRALREVDQQRDDIQADLDSKCEEIVSLRRDSVKMQSLIETKHSELETIRIQLHQSERAREKSESDHLARTREVEHLHQELNRCESDVVSLRRDMKDLSDDLSRAVQETQLISGQLSSAQALNQRHEVRIKEMDKTLARQQEMFRSKNEEYEEILQSYFTTKSDFEVVGRDLKKCAKEIVRLKRMQTAKHEENIGLQKQIDFLQSELSDARTDVLSSRNENERLAYLVSSLEAQLESLSRSEESRVAELGATKTMSESLARSREQVERVAVVLQAKIDHLNQSLEDSQREKSSLQRRVDEYVNRVHELEELISQLRRELMSSYRSYIQDTDTVISLPTTSSSLVHEIGSSEKKNDDEVPMKEVMSTTVRSHSIDSMDESNFDEIRRLHERIIELESSLTEERSRIVSMSEDHLDDRESPPSTSSSDTSASSNSDELVSMVEHLKSELSVAQSSRHKLEGDLADSVERANVFERRAQSLASENTHLLEELERSRREIDRLSLLVEQEQLTLRRVRSNEQHLQSRCELLATELEQLRGMNSSLFDRFRSPETLEREREELTSSRRRIAQLIVDEQNTDEDSAS